MKFRRVRFHNYRCFLTGEVQFKEENGKNINLLLGANGGGKTELLFSFWWVLYGFDFRTLRGKEDTPYALNCDLYKNLELAKIGDTESCSVIVEFEYEGTVYNIKKICEYRKTEKRIMKNEYQELNHYNEKHELTLPIRNVKKINRVISRIIPRSILYGIIFDGERMQKLSVIDDNSKNAIKGVISDVTNIELIENCSENYKEIQKVINRKYKSIAKKTGQFELEEILKELEVCKEKLCSDKKEFNEKKQRLHNVIAELEDISIKLQKFESAKKLEIERQQERKSIEREQKRLNEHYKNFSATLKRGYLLVANKLCEDVDDTITKYDVPKGLTVEAVKSILERPYCICGNPMSNEIVDTLNKLTLTLPPDNINSTLAETIRQMKNHLSITKSNAKKDYQNILSVEKSITNSKRMIASLATQIASGVEEEAKILENRNNDLHEEKGVLVSRTKELENEIPRISSRIEEYRETRDSKHKLTMESKIINKQIKFVDKCLKAIELIKEDNKNLALSAINSKLIEAYKLLSEDYERGRMVYLVQFDKQRKYQIIVYMMSMLNRMIDCWKKNGTYGEMLNSGMSEQEIREQAIIKCSDSNSTGQSKMNTLSFVKAILDYSNESKGEDTFEIRKEYPLLIDAPFGDIFDQNLVKSSSELHTFTHQIILMLSEESYDNVKQYIGPYVNNIYEYVKTPNQNSSIIRCKKGER